MRRAARDLAEYERAQTNTDHFGTFRLGPGEPIDERELLSYLRRARREHPKQELVINVLARDAGVDHEGDPE